MGTTLTIIWIFPHKSYVAWCGDSRLYIYRKNAFLIPVTDDHSLVWEMVKAGELTPEEARIHPESNIITQSLGTPSFPPKPEAKAFEVHQGDRLLLCSDGLNSMLSDEQIYRILSEEESTITACKKLVEEANEAGGRDNITVIILDVKEEVPAVKSITVSQKLRKKK
jgi:protein phosphatase